MKFDSAKMMMKTGTVPEETLKNSVKIVPRSKVTALYMNAWPTNSARPSTARLGYFVKATWAISRKEIVLRCSTRIESSGSESSSSASARTSLSIESTIRSASSSRPWMNSQRGLSGTLRRTIRMPTPRTAPIPKARRQPMLVANSELSSTSDAAEPAAEPSQ